MRLGFLALYLISAAAYFPWRLTVFNADAPIFSAVFFAVEAIGFSWGIIYLFSVLKFPERTAPPAPAGLSVDVFVPSYNEPAEIVRNTIIAALRISYPHETWLLDDGNRPEMRALAAELKCRYLAREQNTDAKAGNINHALAHAKGDFVVLFDADFIASSAFLDHTLGYFTNPKVGFVQTPQEFYNFDSFQHLGRNRSRDAWSEHSLFYRVIQRGRDAYNACMMCGCAVVLRRAALDDIGGIATGTVTEDMHTSVRLHVKGWDSVYHPETLSAGLAPHDASGFRRQRLRWSQGAMQVMRKERLLTRARGLSRFQRTAYLLHIATYMEGLRYTFIFLISAVTLFFNISPLDTDFTTWLLYSMPYIVMSIFLFEEFSRGHGRLLKNEAFNLARFPAYNRALLALIWDRHIPFWVTPKIKEGKKQIYGLPWLILIANLAALAKTAWAYAFGTLVITGWPLAVVMLWACFSMAMAARVCMLTYRCNANRRSFPRFPVALPMTLQPQAAGGVAYPAVVTALSDEGLDLSPHDENGRLPAGLHHGEMQLCDRTISITIDLRADASGKVTGGALSWPSQEARDDYRYLIVADRIRFLSSFDHAEDKTLLRPLLLLARRGLTLRSAPVES
ncbi:MAG TPA: glycosyltransferase [Alphaproteobacteria bacterium]|jgi:cellulose synthase (UDP-forming)